MVEKGYVIQMLSPSLGEGKKERKNYVTDN